MIKKLTRKTILLSMPNVVSVLASLNVNSAYKLSEGGNLS